MAANEKRKQSLYFPDDVLNEISTEAIRLDRSLSWVVQQAWRIASGEVAKFPSVNHAVTAPEAAPRPPSQPTSAAPTPAPLVAEPDSGAALQREPGSQVREFLRGKFEK